MKQIGIAKLKDALSAYVRLVQKGGRFLLTDRGVPVAKLVPVTDQEANASVEETLATLAGEGLVTRAKSPRRAKRHKKLRLSGNQGAQAIIAERETW